MKSDISRDSFDPNKNYSGVYQQQGRMLTDADWNELVDTLKRRMDNTVGASIGSGSPFEGGILVNTALTIKSEYLKNLTYEGKEINYIAIIKNQDTPIKREYYGPVAVSTGLLNETATFVENLNNTSFILSGNALWKSLLLGGISKKTLSFEEFLKIPHFQPGKVYINGNYGELEIDHYKSQYTITELLRFQKHFPAGPLSYKIKKTENEGKLSKNFNDIINRKPELLQNDSSLKSFINSEASSANLSLKALHQDLQHLSESIIEEDKAKGTAGVTLSLDEIKSNADAYFVILADDAFDLNEDYFVYLDLWERLVIAQEEPELRDPALHGADTCVRTQTMVQVKLAKELGQIEQLLAHGTARLEKAPLERPYTPSRTNQHANQLFRIEVHKLTHDSTKKTLEVTLKWSHENAALERSAAKYDDTDFFDEYHIYECFSNITEKHMGEHCITNSKWSPRVSELKNHSEMINLSDELKTDLPRIRRWNGAITLICKNYTEVDFTWNEKETNDPLNLGNKATYSGNKNSLKINLGTGLNDPALYLNLTINNRPAKFIVGDYWLTRIRNLGSSLDISIPSELPVGIKHHYLPIGIYKHDKPGNFRFDSKAWRLLSFPSLTKLTLDRVLVTNSQGKEISLNDKFVNREGDLMSGSLKIGTIKAISGDQKQYKPTLTFSNSGRIGVGTENPVNAVQISTQNNGRITFGDVNNNWHSPDKIQLWCADENNSNKVGHGIGTIDFSNVYGAGSEYIHSTSHKFYRGGILTSEGNWRNELIAEIGVGGYTKGESIGSFPAWDWNRRLDSLFFGTVSAKNFKYSNDILPVIESVKTYRVNETAQMELHNGSTVSYEDISLGFRILFDREVLNPEIWMLNLKLRMPAYIFPNEVTLFSEFDHTNTIEVPTFIQRRSESNEWIIRLKKPDAIETQSKRIVSQYHFHWSNESPTWPGRGSGISVVNISDKFGGGDIDIATKHTEKDSSWVYGFTFFVFQGGSIVTEPTHLSMRVLKKNSNSPATIELHFNGGVSFDSDDFGILKNGNKVNGIEWLVSNIEIPYNQTFKTRINTLFNYDDDHISLKLKGNFGTEPLEPVDIILPKAPSAGMGIWHYSYDQIVESITWHANNHNGNRLPGLTLDKYYNIFGASKILASLELHRNLINKENLKNNILSNPKYILNFWIT